jgi:hypothetical protein
VTEGNEIEDWKISHFVQNDKYYVEFQLENGISMIQNIHLNKGVVILESDFPFAF